MTKTLPWIITLIAVILAFYFWDTGRDRDKSDQAGESRLKSEIADLKAKGATQELFTNDLRRKMDSALVKNRIAQNASKAEIQALRKRERRLRVDTVTRTLVDTIFARQDSVILAVENQRDKIVADCHTLADSLTGQINTQKEIVMKSDTLVQKAERRVDKAEAKLKWWKRALIAAGCIIVYQALKPD